MYSLAVTKEHIICGTYENKICVSVCVCLRLMPLACRHHPYTREHTDSLIYTAHVRVYVIVCDSVLVTN